MHIGLRRCLSPTVSGSHADVMEFQAAPAAFFTRSHYHLKEGFTDSDYSSLGMGQTFFNKVSLSLDGEQLTIICCQWQCLSFPAKIRIFGKLGICHGEVDSFSNKYLKTFLMTSVDLTNNDFLKYVNLWKICITQWTSVFQIEEMIL